MGRCGAFEVRNPLTAARTPCFWVSSPWCKPLGLVVKAVYISRCTRWNEIGESHNIDDEEELDLVDKQSRLSIAPCTFREKRSWNGGLVDIHFIPLSTCF